MKSVNLLFANTPAWIEIENQQQAGAQIIARPPGPGGASQGQFHLELRASPQRGAQVVEKTDQRQFPAFCLERHINSNHTFCLRLGSEAPLEDEEAALEWWSSLRSFLLNQVYTERYGVWPLSAGLSHGPAAYEQLKMEDIAEPLGWKDDVLLAMFRGKGWLAEALPRLSNDGNRVLTARSPCPRGCTRKHKLLRRKSCDLEDCFPGCQKQHKRILRTECPHRRAIEGLVLHEHRRQAIEAKIIRGLSDDGMKCCGTMKRCPLRDLEKGSF